MDIPLPQLGSAVLECVPGVTFDPLHVEVFPRLLLGRRAGGALLLGHLEDGPEGSLWALAALSEEEADEMTKVTLDAWDDEGWDEAYDMLDDELSVSLVQTNLQGVVVSLGEVSPRPIELEALLDAALDAFE